MLTLFTVTCEPISLIIRTFVVVINIKSKLLTIRFRSMIRREI